MNRQLFWCLQVVLVFAHAALGSTANAQWYKFGLGSKSSASTSSSSRSPSVPPSPGRTGEEPLRVCSQNIFRFGAASSGERFSRGKRKQYRHVDSREMQRDYLVSRMKRAKCDIVAMQEVPAGPDDRPEALAGELASTLTEQTGNSFTPYLARSSDGHIKNGFLVREGSGTVVSVTDLDQSLPRLQRSPGPRGYFGRAPLVLSYEYTAAPGAAPRRILFISMHFKSRVNSASDPTRTQFEALRLEMAEAVRNFALEEITKHPATAVVVMGDRNSAADSGSAHVLTGERQLADFRDGDCRIDQALEAECNSLQGHQKQLVGLFAYRNELFPQRYRDGSFKYRKQEEMIDEILVRPDDVALVQRPDATLAIGLEGEFYKGSDHRLLWAELDWSRPKAEK